MRIEQFLFEENVERSFSKYLIDRFPNLIFDTKTDFRDFFENQGIKLIKNKVGNSSSKELADSRNLVETFKNFKSSDDYRAVREYIAIQKRIKKAMDSGDIDTANLLLEQIEDNTIDPFYNFIVRKALTGSEEGELPSEAFIEYFEEVINVPPEINIVPDVPRDTTGKIISFENYLRNEGSIKVEIFDERIDIESFKYVVPNQFVQLEEARDAERTILARADDIENLRKLSPEEQDFIQNLRNVISEDTNNIDLAKIKIEELEKQLEDLNEIVDTKEQDNANLQLVINELAAQTALAESEVLAKDDAIAELTSTIDSTISDLQENIADQLTITADAFDALSEKLDKQSSKQLEVFNKLADAFSPDQDPKPSDDNPAKDEINGVSNEWERLTVIPATKYTLFLQILDELEVKNRPSRYDYVYVAPTLPGTSDASKNNKYTPSEEIRQHLNWNKKYKNDFKKVLVKITDTEKVKRILATTREILKDPSCLENRALYETITDALNAWSIDFGRSRGVGLPSVKKVVLEVGADDSWNFADEKNPTRSEAIGAARATIKKLTRDTNQMLNILQFLSEIKTDSGW